MLNKMTFTSFMRKYRIEDGKGLLDNLKEAQKLGIDSIEIENKLNAVMTAFSDLEKLGTTIERHKANNEAVNVETVYELWYCLSDIMEFIVWANKGTSECLNELIATKENVIEQQKEFINVLENTAVLNDELLDRFSNILQSTRK